MIEKSKIRRFGFTLIELLVVLAIIVALFAILTPNILSYRARVADRQASSQIKNFERALEDYATDFGKYPTTEQGLKALIYIPANEAMAGMMTAQSGAMGQIQPGMPGTDPNAAFGGGAAAVGGDLLTQPGAMGGNPMDPAGGMGMQPGGMGTMPMDPAGGMGMQPGGMGAMPMDPAGGMGMQPGGMGAMPMDPTGMGMQPGMGAGAMGTGWTQPISNPALYTNPRKRPQPFLPGDDVPLDPWKNPYRYDNTLYSGVNRYTGEQKPAIWSAGPDGVDGNEDDVRNWDPAVAQQQLMHLQHQGMGGMGGVGANPMDPTGMGTMPMDPTGGMGTQPGGMGTMPMDPTGGMGMQPGGMGTMPMAPAGGMGMQPGGMGTMPMAPNNMGTPPMPAPQPAPQPPIQ